MQAQSRIGVLSWNVGGLSNAILDEILLWLSLPANQGIRVVFLQETRWKFTSEWENDKWCLVHSGHTKQKGAGILTLISKELCAPADVRVRVLASGRALHVRVPLAKCGTSLDLLNVYQHAWDQRADMAQLTVKRAYVLAQVDACIQQLPWRNLCVCAGDMNAQLAPLPGLVGNSTKCTEIQRQSAPDAMSLQDMVIARQLVALNTWSGPRRHSFTYENQGRHTQIDYVFARRHQVTPCMRNCRPIPDFPITAWRQTGLRRPLVVSVDYVWRPAQLQAGRRIDTDAMARAHMQQSPLIASFRRDVQRAIQEVAPEDPASLHQILYDSSLKHFPAQPVRKQYAYQHEEVERAVQSRWLRLNQGKFYRQTATTCLASAWKCWYHFARFRAMRRDANRASRQARKQRYDRLLLEAESDTAQRCVHRLYAVIRQMAPKQPFRRVKIYGENGEVIDRQAEAGRLQSHFQRLFQDDAGACAPMNAPGLQLPTSEDICWALSKTPLRKAVPRHMAPGVSWRAAAEEVCPTVLSAVCAAWSTFEVPQPWKDGWMVLAQKPQKPGRDPSDYRPLCLQDPCGKAMIRLLAERIRPVIQAYARRCPQYAYLAGRSMEGALLNVFHRCRRIRQLTQSSGYSVFARRAGEVSTPFTGGIMLSLDLSAAFDSVPRQQVQKSLIAAGVATQDIRMIMSWMEGSCYHLQHAQVSLSILTTKGVRQGCVLSPLIWTCFTCFVVYGLQDFLDLDDLQLFADDFLWSKIFHTKEQLLDTLRVVPRFLTRLAEHGMQVNLTKTAALVRMARPEGRHFLRQHMCQTSKQKYLCFLGAQPLRVPVKKEHVYLGCVISLYDFEGATIRHRITAARNQFSRLRSVLTSSRCLSPARRGRIWKACIWSTLLYGWLCCGGSGYMLQQVLSLVNTQLRTVARSPRHIMHTANTEVCHMLHLPSPHEMIMQSADNLRQRLSYATQLPDDDVMTRPTLHAQAEWALDSISAALAGCGRLARVDLTEGVPCPVCGIYFESTSSMRKHKTRKHPEAEVEQPLPVTQVQREAHCVDGMPVCRGCGKAFHHMQTLLRHIRNRRCPGMLEEAVPPKINEPLPLMRRVELVEAWHVGGVQALLLALGSSELSKELLHHCCICRQWTSDHRHFKTHIKRAHPDLHTSCHELALADCRGLAGEIMNPCPFCKQSVTNRTRHVMACPVLYQAAFSCRAHGRTIQGECHLTLLGRAPSSKHAVEPEATGHATERQEGSVELRATAQVSAVRQAQERRQRQAKGPPTTRGIPSFFARQCGKPADPADGTAVPQKRGCHQHPSYGQGLCHDVQDEGRGDHAPNNQGPGNQMARTQGRRQNGVLQADCPVQRCDPGAPDAREGAAGEGREDQVFDQPGLAHSARAARAHVATLGVVSGKSERHTMSGLGTAPSYPGDEVPGHHPGACNEPDRPEIPLDPPSGKGVQRRSNGVSAGGEPSRSHPPESPRHWDN